MLWGLLLFFSCQTTVASDGNSTTVEFYRTTTHSKGIRNAINSSVVVHCFEGGEYQSKGSGNYFKIGNKRFILTASHVVEGCDDVQLMNKPKSLVTAKTIYQDKERDIAILTADQKLYDVLPIEYYSKAPELGERVYFMGHPDEINFFLFEGLVSLDSTDEFFLHSTGWGGVSGAIVFNRTGRVFGVTKAVKVTFSPATGFPRLLEDMVLVSKVDHLTRAKIREIMDEAK